MHWMYSFIVQSSVTDIYRSKCQVLLLAFLLFSACSTVSHLPEGELLYTGTQYVHVEDDAPAPLRNEAVDKARVAFILPPNNALFGSSRYRTPFPVGLWAYNAFVDDSIGIRRWLFKSFAVTPVLISTVNPEFRASVAENTLHNYGYFDSEVTFQIDTVPEHRKASVGYTMKLRHPWYYGNIDYVGFSSSMDSLIRSTWSERLLYENGQFNYTDLVGERNRLFTLFRENGYYYFRPDMIQLLADSVERRGHVQLRISPKPTLADYIVRPWYIGNTSLDISDGFTVADSTRPLVRNSVVMPRIGFRRGDLYSSAVQDATLRNLNRLGIFNAVSVNYVPRDTVICSDTLDVYINALLEKPYEVSLEANLTAKSNNQVGPGAVATLARKNLFRMAETIQLRLKGSYEWQTDRTLRRESSVGNSFELGADASLLMPQLLFPIGYGYHYLRPVSTTARLYVEWLNRGGFFRMLAFGGNLTYAFSTSDALSHSVTPMRLTFNTLERTTHRFDSVMTANPAIGLSFRNQFVPAFSYTATYDNTSVASRHPMKLTASFTSAGAVTSLIYAIAGYPFGEQNKTLLGTPFAQFLKGTVEWCRYFHFSSRHILATRFVGGAIYSYGNARVAPFSEQFYVGGASDLRAFPLRGIGPGSYHSSGRYAYIDHTGDLKLEANVEWRFPLVGQLSGALFLDAGNVWLLRDDKVRPGAQFRWRTFTRDVALGTGFGLRYNLRVILLRADMGIPLHIPYNTGMRGYYNVPHFGRGLCFHFGVGYPF